MIRCKGFRLNFGPLFQRAAVLLCLLSGSFTSVMAEGPQNALNNSTDFRLQGKILYPESRAYLPRCIVDESGSASGLTVQYTFEVIYGTVDLPDILSYVNPLTIYGFPFGEDTLFLIGNLQIGKKEELIKSYSATYVLQKKPGQSGEEIFPKLRHQALIDIRDHIEAQIFQDRDFFTKMSASGPSQ